MRPYTTVSRASAKEKEAMRDLVVGLNHIAERDGDTSRYRIEKGTTQYVIVVQTEESTERGSLVRCASCGHIRELFEGQIEFCPECEASWE